MKDCFPCRVFLCPTLPNCPTFEKCGFYEVGQFLLFDSIWLIAFAQHAQHTRPFFTMTELALRAGEGFFLELNFSREMRGWNRGPRVRFVFPKGGIPPSPPAPLWRARLHGSPHRKGCP